MKKIIEEFLKSIEKNSAPSNELVLALQEKIDFDIDEDYLDFIKIYNGAAGFLDGNFFIQLWCIEDVLALNPYYEDVEICKNLFFFGTDGSNNGFAFDKKNKKIVSIGFLDMLDYIPDIMCDNFRLFLMRDSSL